MANWTPEAALSLFHDNQRVLVDAIALVGEGSPGGGLRNPGS
ncbi:hypothetical protein [Streptomyces sp. 150FB]|nr:hypothetical protein [Streptomyces sp. 150FB]